jgi:hypothetical protein
MTKLVDDVVGVIRYLGFETCVLVGHGARARLKKRRWCCPYILYSGLHVATRPLQPLLGSILMSNGATYLWASIWQSSV